MLDASAMLNFMAGGAASGQVTRLFENAARHGRPLLASMLNWGEAFYISWQRNGEEAAQSQLANLTRLSLELVPVDLAQVVLASELKVRHKIPYVDCIAAALAIQHDAILVTSDRDFEKLGRRVDVLWLKRP